MKRILIALALVLFASTAHAQTANPASKLGWDEVGQTIVAASGAAYNLYVDGATTPIAVQNVVCTSGGGTSTTVSCVASFPALTPGTHSVTLTQTIAGAESGKSIPLAITFVVVIVPTNLSVK